MGMLDGVRQDFKQCRSFLRCNGMGTLKLTESAAIGIFENHIPVLVVVDEFMNLHEMRMVQRSHRMSFAFKTKERIAVASVDDLDRYKAIQRQLPSAIDDPHSTTAKFIQNFVTGNFEINLGLTKCGGSRGINLHNGLFAVWQRLGDSHDGHSA